MNLLLPRTSGPSTTTITTSSFLLLLSVTLLCLCASCAATPNTLVDHTTLSPVSNGSDPLSVPEVAPTALPSSSSPSSQNVNQTFESAVISSTPSTVDVTEDSSNSTSSSVLPVNSSTPVPTIISISNTTTDTNTTTTAPHPLISFDPEAGGIVISDTFANLFSSNDSKLVIKYVNKANDALKKQTQKWTFKTVGATGENGSIPQFVAKFLVKNVNTNASERQFKDFMSDEIRNRGGVILHFILLLYVCLSLGIICDLYFLTSIEYIGNILNLPADIAGATFMALGTSAPELFIALIGVFIAEDDIGTSTILGSAVFNLIFVPSVCGFAIYFARLKYPKINKYAILRDAIMYIIAITTLLLALKDNEIDWIESVSMLTMYCIYITILYYNAQLGELVEIDSDTESETTSCDSETSPLLQSQNSTIAAFTKSEKHALTKSADWIEHGSYGRLRKGSLLSRPIGRTNSIRTSSIRNGSMIGLPNGYLPIAEAKAAIHEEPSGMPENWAESHILLKILMFPVVLLIKLTVPKPNKHNYFLTFVISILWISGFTYMSVWLVTIIGYTLQLPQTVLGLTILAAGASIPEVISSVIVVKRAGLANMALCNLFGSNIFDILVCLGLPWLIKSVISMVTLGTTDLMMTVVTVQSNGLLLTVFTLMICVISFVVTLGCCGWKLGLGVGVTLNLIYFTAITMATTYEILLN